MHTEPTNEFPDLNLYYDLENLDLTQPEKAGPVTRADVEAAMRDLAARGEEPSTRKIRAHMGRGSNETVDKHFKNILLGRDAKPVAPRPSVLSVEVIRALARDVQRLVDERTAHLNESLQKACASLEAALEVTEDLRTALAEAESQVNGMRASLASQAGIAKVHREQSTDLAAQLAVAKSRVEDARQQAAALSSNLNASEGGRARAEEECSRLQNQLAEVLHAAHETESQLARERRKCAELEGRLVGTGALDKRLQQAAEEATKHAAELAAARASLAASEAERVGLTARLDDTKQALASTETTLKKLLENMGRA